MRRIIFLTMVFFLTVVSTLSWATVDTTTTRVVYTGTGTVGPFSVPFRFNANTDLVAIKTLASTGAETILTLYVDYNLAGVGTGSGTLTLLSVLPSTYKLTIMRSMDFLQQTTYVEHDPFTAATHNAVLDKLAMELQQVKDVGARSVQLSRSSSLATPYLPPPIANYMLGWNSAATGLANFATTTLTIPQIDYIGNYGDSLSTMVASVGANPKTMMIDKAITVDGNVTIPLNINLWFQEGAILTRTGGDHLWINGTMTGPDSQRFEDNTATHDWVVMDTNTSKVNPKWWGAPGNGSDNDTIYVVSAYNSMDHPKIIMSDKKWKFNLTIAKNNTEIECSGKSPGVVMEQTGVDGGFLRAADLSEPVIQIGNDAATIYDVKIRNCSIYGWDGTDRGAKGVKIGSSIYHALENVFIGGFSTYNLMLGDYTYTHPTMSGKFSDIEIGSAVANGDSIVCESQPPDAATTAQFFSNFMIWGPSTGAGYNWAIKNPAPLHMVNGYVEVQRCGKGIAITDWSPVHLNGVTIEGQNATCEVVSNSYDTDSTIQRFLVGNYDIINGVYGNNSGIVTERAAIVGPYSYLLDPILWSPTIRYVMGFVEGNSINGSSGDDITINRSGSDLYSINRVGKFYQRAYDDSNSSIIDALVVQRTSESGKGSIGMGVSLNLGLPDSNGTLQTPGRIYAKWADASGGSYDGQVCIATAKAGVAPTEDFCWPNTQGDFSSTSGIAVAATSVNSNAITATSTNNQAIVGTSLHSQAIVGLSDNNTAFYGTSTDGICSVCSSSSLYGGYFASGSSYGVMGVSTSSNGVVASSPAVPLLALNTTDSNSTSTTSLLLNRQVGAGGDPGIAGVGSKITTWLPTSTGASASASVIDTVATTATDGNYTSKVILSTLTANAQDDVITLARGVATLKGINTPIGATPGSSAYTCTKGAIWWDNATIYVCTDTDHVKKTALANF
jgi:hypothetical protein